MAYLDRKLMFLKLSIQKCAINLTSYYGNVELSWKKTVLKLKQ